MRVQPDLIKLDRSLVSAVDGDPARAALIEFFVTFAKRIDAQVCCEGIETAAELAALAGLGVNLAQGYLLGRPSGPWATIAAPAATAIMQLQQRGLLQAPDRPVRTSGPVNRRLGARAVRR
jgi:EAL domain-containing protein (putative c-di-GMP-specific phosphodiesterase class I)